MDKPNDCAENVEINKNPHLGIHKRYPASFPFDLFELFEK
jgi:hypothetical protein